MEQEEVNKTLGLKEILRGLRTVVRYAEEQKKDFGGLVTITIILAVLSAFTPYIWGIFIDSITFFVRHENTTIFHSPFFILGAWFVIVVATNTLSWLKSLKARKVEETIRHTYRIKAHRHLLLLPVSFHVHNKAGEVSEKLGNGL